jgi:hypothetical protein
MRRQPRPQTAAFVWDLLSSKSSNFPPKWYSVQKQILDGPQELMGRAHSPLRGADTTLNTLILKTVTMGPGLFKVWELKRGIRVFLIQLILWAKSKALGRSTSSSL